MSSTALGFESLRALDELAIVRAREKAEKTLGAMELMGSARFWDPVSETITPLQSKTRGGELGISPRFQNRERHPASTVCWENAGTRSESVGEALNQSASVAL